MKFALIADLHFGSVPEGLADDLAGALKEHAPDLIIVAGDLTMRARAREFEQAQAWLGGLAQPILVLPGNHDLPYLNLYQRFADPFGRFRTTVGASLMPTFTHARGFVVGFNTARSWQPHLRWQEGVARREDIAAARLALSGAAPGAIRIVAAHHPFLRPAERSRVRPVLRARTALQSFVESGAEMVLSGHTHQSFAAEADHGGRRIIAIGAPTALSWRKRGEENGYWLVNVEDGAIGAQLYLRNRAGFAPASERHFARPGPHAP